MAELEYKKAREFVAKADWVMLDNGRYVNSMINHRWTRVGSASLYGLGIYETPNGKSTYIDGQGTDNPAFWIAYYILHPRSPGWTDLKYLANILGKPVIAYESCLPAWTSNRDFASWHRKSLPSFPDGTDLRERLGFYAKWITRI